MHKTITCPACNMKMEISCELHTSLYDYPIKTIIRFLNDHISNPNNNLKLVKITENSYFFKADVTTNLSNSELINLIDSITGFCEACGRSNSSFTQLSDNIPSLYEGPMSAGGIGPTTLTYKNNVIKAHDPGPEVTVELTVVNDGL